jgi:SAM-dependent methyltransferase
VSAEPPKSPRQRMLRLYDRTMVGRHQRRYYEDSGFYNFGYWGGHASSQREASEALVDQLVARIVGKHGRILDVACGLGASTKRLMLSYPSGMITAINLSETQLAEARKRAPGCDFRQMDAVRLDFPDAHFDAVICVEAAFHFETRERFLGEAMRVLKPAGSLVLSDIIFRRSWVPQEHVPRANLVPDIPSYRQLLQAAGFADIDVQDETQACLGGFRRNLVHWPAAERRAGHIKLAKSIRTWLFCHLIAGYFGAICKTYVLVSGRKPVHN